MLFRERFRLGKLARTDYLTLEKITLQRGERAGPGIASLAIHAMYISRIMAGDRP